MRDDPKPTVVECGPFRLRTFFFRDIEGKTGWRAEISGAWQSGPFATEKDAKNHVAKHGLDIVRPLFDKLEEIHAKSTNRGR